MLMASYKDLNDTGEQRDPLFSQKHAHTNNWEVILSNTNTQSNVRPNAHKHTCKLYRTNVFVPTLSILSCDDAKFPLAKRNGKKMLNANLDENLNP